MNDTIRNVMLLRYKAEVEDAKYKIKCNSDHELAIPEHPDITAEIDKLLSTIAEAEDKMAVIKLHYGENKTNKTPLPSQQCILDGGLDTEFEYDGYQARLLSFIEMRSG